MKEKARNNGEFKTFKSFKQFKPSETDSVG
jgi:hypothetical protein